MVDVERQVEWGTLIKISLRCLSLCRTASMFLVQLNQPRPHDRFQARTWLWLVISV